MFTQVLLFHGYLSYILGQDFTHIDAIVKSDNYDKRSRPQGRGGTGPVRILTQINFIAFGNINAQTFTYEAEFYLRNWWFDTRLFHNNSTEDLTSHTPPEDLIWTPDIVVINAKDTTFYKNANRLIIKPNGEVFTSRRVKAICHCNMDLRYYPMDTQICPMSFESYAYSAEHLLLEWHENSVFLSDNVKTTGYVVTGIYAESKNLSQPVADHIDTYRYLIVYFKVKRTFLYYLYRAYIPTILLMIFNIASYWVPATAVPARITLIVTTFLSCTFILQSVSNETIQVSYTTPMQMFLLVNVVFIVASVIEFVAVMVLQSKQQKKASKCIENKNTNLQRTTSTVKINEEGMNQEKDENKTEDGGYTMTVFTSLLTKDDNTNKTHIVDRSCQIVAPITYSLFCIIYFTYYLSLAEVKP